MSAADTVEMTDVRCETCEGSGALWIYRQAGEDGPSTCDVCRGRGVIVTPVLKPTPPPPSLEAQLRNTKIMREFAERTMHSTGAHLDLIRDLLRDIRAAKALTPELLARLNRFVPEEE